MRLLLALSKREIDQYRPAGPKKLASQPIAFPDTPTVDTLRSITFDWTANFDNERWTQTACAACGALHNSDDAVLLPRSSITASWLEPLRAPSDFLPFLLQTDPEHRASLFSFSDPLLDGHLLEERGIRRAPDGEVVGIHACKTCRDALRKGNVPASSLMNGLWCGPTPPELEELTPAEEIVIGLARSSYNALFFLKAPVHNGPLETRQRASRGHWVAYPQHVDRIHEAVTSLPHRATDLADVLHITLVGPVSAECRTLKKALSVSMRRVWAAFDWLKEHNELYAGVVWDNEAAATYGEDGAVPVELARHVWPEDTEMEERETYGTADADPASADPKDGLTNRRCGLPTGEAMGAFNPDGGDDEDRDEDTDVDSDVFDFDEEEEEACPDDEDARRRQIETRAIMEGELDPRWSLAQRDDLEGERDGVITTSGIVDVSGRRVSMEERKRAATGRIIGASTSSLQK